MLMPRTKKGSSFNFSVVGGLIAIEIILVLSGIIMHNFVENRTKAIPVWNNSNSSQTALYYDPAPITGLSALFLPYIPLAFYILAFILPFASIYYLIQVKKGY